MAAMEYFVIWIGAAILCGFALKLGLGLSGLWLGLVSFALAGAVVFLIGRSKLERAADDESPSAAPVE